MATHDGKFLRGVLGELVFKKVNGKQVVSKRIPRGTMKKTAGMKRSTNTFGMAASLAAAIRNTFSVQINQLQDGMANARLTGEMCKILGNTRNPGSLLYSFDRNSFRGLIGFEFNQFSKLKSWLVGLPDIELAGGILNVRFGEMLITRELKFPGGGFQCQILVCVSLFRLNDGLAAELPDVKTVVITMDQGRVPAQNLQFEVPPGCLCITSLFLEYAAAGKNGWEVLNHKKLNPGRICDAVITPGTYQQQGKRTWFDMVSFDQK